MGWCLQCTEVAQYDAFGQGGLPQSMDDAAVGQWVEAQVILFGMEHLAQFFKALPGLFAAADVQEYAILQGDGVLD